MITIDKNYEGIKPHPYRSNWYIFNGDMILKDDVEILINLVVDGHQIIGGDQKIKGHQIIGGDQKIQGDQIIGGDQKIKGHQIIGGDQKIQGDQIIKGNQKIQGYQIIGGDQKIKGHQIIGGDQKIQGDQIILNHKTNFSLSFMQDKYRLYFMSNLIKIGCQCHSPKQWEKFSDEEISKMAIDALKWWNKWKSFVLTTHKELVKVYGEV